MNYNKKIICVGIIKVIAFLLIFLLLFQSLTNLFRTKSFYYSVSPIYELPKNSVDVLLLGSSHMNCSISPMDLWNDYGITSFNAAMGNQTIPASYFELRELLKVQRPKVVVLETFKIWQNSMISPESQLHLLVDNIPFSLGVNETINTLIQENHDKTEYYINFYSFHDRWKELSEVDFNPSLSYSKWNRGADVTLYNRHSVKEPPTTPLSEREMPPELSLEYLYKIIELCREEKIPLVLMAQPFNDDSTWHKTMNYVDVIAEKEKIPYINFFYLLDEIEFDFAKDMADHHVNYFGVRKLTSYLGEYLKNNYQLEDHREDPVIANQWNQDYEIFTRELNNIMMKITENVDEYFNHLRKMDYIIAWNAYSETPLSETALPEFLRSLGIDSVGIKEENWYCAVTKGELLLYEKALDIRPNDSYMVDDMLFSFGDGIIESTNRIGIHVGRKECSAGDTGVNLIVYDPVSQTVVDSVNIDLDTKDIKRRTVS